jgi:hypothetical protein
MGGVDGLSRRTLFIHSFHRREPKGLLERLQKPLSQKMTDTFDNLELAVKLDSPDLRKEHDLFAVLQSAIRSRTELPSLQAQSPQPFWPAEHFGLDQVSIFFRAEEAQRQAILKVCTQNVLAESYYIEKCGMYFAAKMSLLSDNTQERMLYSLFASDEAVHFNWIANFISQETVRGFLQNPFIKLLEELLQRAERATLAYVVQVILEGWGIHHYRALGRGCLDANLKSVFEAIVKDEARHHASGLILINEQKLTDKQLDNLAATLTQFFRMVQAGPQMLVSAIEQVKGGLSKEQKREIFTELNCEIETAKRLQLLRSFIKAAAFSEVILDALERAKAFRPFTAAECADS